MTERVRQIIREDRRRTIDEVTMLVGISHGTCILNTGRQTRFKVQVSDASWLQQKAQHTVVISCKVPGVNGG